MDWYLAAAWVFGGSFVGTLITRAFYRLTHAQGSLILDTSDPEKDVYTFNGFDREVLRKKRYLELRIVNKQIR